ncbi:hypothetical protein K437DRAFT_109247 [Tilletiaria anomala UBC 951]|uniref:Uncharacterized protein n=1 Tax=Tilletiaria anomala (strain ATCC 24038 / CBS 436.72 / UBC 951) TaxID=1037660 RepID=A0A066VX45_TILAU|nr:uncharacterized protein K437DRAFT_109247 [Tilletiaria anomala UBC 951]KDN46297.1 hypothetical protein K437DRAFT_109247 [Tilletiaria anomala UBC 951]
MTAESGTQGRGASAMQKQNPKGRLVLNDSESGSDTEMAPPPPSCKRGEVASITKSPAELAATKRQCLGSVLSNDTDGDNTSTCSRSLAPARVEDAVGLGACGGSNNGKSTLRGQSVSETMESARSSASCGIIRRHAAAASAINAIDSDSDGETFKFSTTRSRIRPGATGSSSRTRAGRR